MFSCSFVSLSCLGTGGVLNPEGEGFLAGDFLPESSDESSSEELFAKASAKDII